MSALSSSLESARPLYFLPGDPLGEEVLIPAFSSADSFDCMAGFFSSQVFASLAPGVATFLQNSDKPMRLIISPYIRPDDQAAIEYGLKDPAEVGLEAVEHLFVTEDLLQSHTLKCFSWLLRTGRLEIKIAVMRDALFHPKVWIFRCADDWLVAHGSGNATNAGVQKNIEQIAVSKSWEDAIQYYVADKFVSQFAQYWSGNPEDCMVVPVSQAISERLLKPFNSSIPPSEDDLNSIYHRLASAGGDAETSPENLRLDRPVFAIPDYLRYEDGSFAHQGKAVSEWLGNGCQGVLEMATGSGKTIAAMICAYKLYEKTRPLLLVVSAPYIPLVQQWCDEIEEFGLSPFDITDANGPRGRAKQLNTIKRRFRAGISDVEVVVVSHDTLCTSEFQDQVSGIESAKLLIADEAHNLGREQFVNNPPEFFEFRLGLSATPVRQYDEEGTRELFKYFGDVVFRFTLEEAIGKCLVEYDYYVHPVDLTPTEMDEWYELTEKIRANAWRQNEGSPDDYLAKLFRDRRKLLETASNKIIALAKLLDREDLKALKHTLIYATDKDPRQLEEVNGLLSKRRILFHQLTYEETRDRRKTARIIRDFQSGALRVLTAKRVLDEGVNIPQISKAYVLASTTVERQWVQRRGRLLRTCKEIGKTHSEIHDFMALPCDLDQVDEDAKALIKSELVRVQEFARLARNAGRPDGPLGVIDKLVQLIY